jgi:hypothetical protein
MSLDWLTQSANPYPIRPIRTLGWMGVDPDPTHMDMDGRHPTHINMDNPLGAHDIQP